jgi:hypothetical protein
MAFTVAAAATVETRPKTANIAAPEINVRMKCLIVLIRRYVFQFGRSRELRLCLLHSTAKNAILPWLQIMGAKSGKGLMLESWDWNTHFR